MIGVGSDRRPPHSTAHRALRLLITIEGAAYLLTAAWPLVHPSSFLALVGPKPDPFQLLVTDLLVLAIGTSLLVGALPPGHADGIPGAAYALALGTPLAFMIVELRYRDGLASVYWVDFAVELILVILLIALGWRARKADIDRRGELPGPEGE